MIEHIFEIGDCAGEFPAVDGLGGFAGIFEGDAEVGAAGAGGFGVFDLSGGVADLVEGGLC